MKKNKLIIAFLLLGLAIASCTKEDEMIATLTIPSTYEYSNVDVSGQTYIVTQGGNYEAISSQLYHQNVPGFEGFLFDDLMDSMQVSTRPAASIDFISEEKADVYGVKLLFQTFDLEDLDYTEDGSKILIDQDFDTDRFTMHMELVDASTIQINYGAFQIQKEGETLPFTIDQIVDSNTLEEAALSVFETHELVEGDYFYVIHGEYFYTKK